MSSQLARSEPLAARRADWAPRDRAEAVLDLIRELFPIKGLMVSPDLDRAMARLAEELPGLVIHEYPSGLECEDWIVPQSWEAKAARLTDEQGRVLASLDEHFLFVAPYSEPVDGWFTKEEIAAHSRTRPDVPDAYLLEHRNAYNYSLVDWGITLPYRVWEQLSDDARYRVEIEVETKPGVMRVGEYFLPGRRPEVICLNGHIDELCNDDLSGTILGLEVMRGLIERPEREFSYQLLLAPEMMGTLFYVLNNRERVAKTVGMLNLEAVGAGESWALKRAFKDGEVFEESLRAAFARLGYGYEELDFFDGYGNDERVIAWPTIGIPGIGLQRHPFAEYHTSKDTPELLSLDLLTEAIEICDAFIDVMERNYVPAYVNFAQPWLTRHGLYFDAVEDRENFRKFNNLVLFNLDGEKSVLELARLSGLDFDTVWRFLEAFVEKRLVRKQPLPLAAKAG